MINDESKVFRYQILINGIVQGVGFRPHIFRLAKKHNLQGYVINTTKGVQIEVEGKGSEVNNFVNELNNGNLPPLSKVYSINVKELEPQGYTSFTIKESIADDEKITLISPDISICEDCIRELFDPHDRRHQYPFINCTNCGPRYSIIKRLPYDRVNTTMTEFKMCDDCQKEYDEPINRRFHAQPNACFKCGPNVKLVHKDKIVSESIAAVKEAIKLLEDGNIVSIKGIGGFHLAVDASNDEAVKRLREKKGREEKPFAIMVKDEANVERICYVRDIEKHFLLMPQRPIILLRRKDTNLISEYVAPSNKYYGVFLPYTPLHYLIMDGGYVALVMTSANISDEPICKDNEEAFVRMARIADYFLINNREIYQRCDDSVMTVVRDMPLVIRRSRGYAPEPVILPFRIKPVLATGAYLKNTVCLAFDDKAFISQHIGDLETYENYAFFIEGIKHLKSIFSVEPEAIICDMHPTYLSTRYAEQQGLSLIKVQHHEAHIASCMAENHLVEEVIGISFDGTGYGKDGKIWGSEFFVGKPNNFKRVAHFDYVDMVGGDFAAKEPYRMAIAYLYKYFGLEWIKEPLEFISAIAKNKIEGIIHMIDERINCWQTCGCGRLFDAVSSLINLRMVNRYEGQAPIELEMNIDDEFKSDDYYSFNIKEEDDCSVISFYSLFTELMDDLIRKVPKALVAVKFHNSIVRIVVEMCGRLSKRYKLKRVVISGGCFQNKYLVEKVVMGLKESGYEVYYHQQLPPNDGGISLGQVYIYGYTNGAPLL